MTKLQLATKIEQHHLYSPLTEGVDSKNYYKYSSVKEIKQLMRFPKQELQDCYDNLYGSDGRELSAHEINN